MTVEEVFGGQNESTATLGSCSYLFQLTALPPPPLRLKGFPKYNYNVESSDYPLELNKIVTWLITNTLWIDLSQTYYLFTLANQSTDATSLVFKLI